MTGQIELEALIIRWLGDVNEGRHDKVKTEITLHLNLDGRGDRAYLGLAQILMDIDEFNLAMVELEHVVMAGKEEHYIKSALVFNGYCLKKIGDSYEEAGSWEVAKGYYLLALQQLSLGLAGVLPVKVGLCGMTYKADVHNKLGEYEMALGTIATLMATPDIYFQADNETRARIAGLMITSKNGIDSRGGN